LHTIKTLLVLAHPGHELRVFHWMECVSPEVFILTDGSGGSQVPRTSYSEEVVARAGAKAGQPFGAMSDRLWYDAILAKDPDPFRQFADAVFNAAEGADAVAVVADAVDGYNPVHDLTSAIGASVNMRLRQAGIAVTDFLVSAAVPGVTACEALEVRLDADARERKLNAVRAYAPLADEARRVLAEAPESFSHEVLHRQDFHWPDDFVPFWEKLARDRVSTGRYTRAITYRDHVLPIARALMG